jgi:hypothetical protein
MDLGFSYLNHYFSLQVIAPLIKRYPTRSVLSYAVLTFGLISAIVLIVDGSTGGKLRSSTVDNKTHYGRNQCDRGCCR